LSRSASEDVIKSKVGGIIYTLTGATLKSH
jgi:hypothetical protein